jgi:hypothetical protein
MDKRLRGRFRPLPEASTKPPAEQILAGLEWIARSLTSARDFRGCAFLNVLAELGSEDSEVRELAVAYKESRRLCILTCLRLKATTWSDPANSRKQAP